jgi:hypothetical protein
MADQLDSNTREPNPESEIDDPLAELARIIGYERPPEPSAASPSDHEVEASGFDLEAELMRELDVLPPDVADTIDPANEPESVGQPGPDPAASEAALDDDFEFDESWLDNKPAYDSSEAGLDRDLAPRDSTDFQAGTDPAGVAAIDADPDVWDAPEMDAGWDGVVPGIEPETAPRPVTPEDSGNSPERGPKEAGLNEAGPNESGADELGQVIPAGLGAAAKLRDPSGPREVSGSAAGGSPPASVPVEDMDDDVLADMFRFELPDNGADARGNAAAANAAAASVDDRDIGLDLSAAFEDDSGGVPRGDFDDDGADDSSRTGLSDPAPVPDRDAPGAIADREEAVIGEAAAAADNHGGPAEIDFEDYLSAELDVFEHQAAIAQQGESFEPAFAGPDPSDGHGGTVATADGADALDTDADFLFDEAAEELLADIAQDEIIANAGVEDTWSEASLEEGITEELSEELEDMFEPPETSRGLADDRSDGTGELELDLEQVLAESVIGFEPELETPSDAARAENGGEWRVASDHPEAGSDFDPSGRDPEQDEMAEAFLGLVPAENQQAAADPAGQEWSQAPAPELPVDPDPRQDDDWLAGFETGAKQGDADSDGYFFDADMITEPDEPVEAVAEIDVPELVHDEPLPIDPDFDSEIEREFADIIDSDPQPAGPRAGSAVQGGFAAASTAADGWSRQSGVGREYEGSDDYIALERELGGEDVHVAPPYETGGPGGHEPSPMDDEYATGMRTEPAAQSNSRGPVVALAVLGLALLAGAGAFGWSMMSGGDGATDDGPRIIRADKEPVKVLPENPGGVTVPNQDKAVYDRVAGGEAAQPGQPALVNTAEEPVDVVQRTLDPDVLPLEGRDQGPAVKSEERLAANGGSEATSGADAAAPVISPRRVRTMIVKPDGSIVAREDPAPETAQPAETTEAQAPAALAAAEPLQTPARADSTVSPQDSSPVAASEEAEEPVQAEAEPEAPVGTVAPVRVVTTQPIRAPIPQGRPADQPVNVVGTVTQGGNVAPAPAAAAAPAQSTEVAAAPAAAAPVANPGGYYVQIASQPTAEGAQASWRTLSNRFSSVIGGQTVDIQRADIPGKGVFHRVRIPAGSREQANALCSRYKAAGGSCFVSR